MLLTSRSLTVWTGTIKQLRKRKNSSTTKARGCYDSYYQRSHLDLHHQLLLAPVRHIRFFCFPWWASLSKKREISARELLFYCMYSCAVGPKFYELISFVNFHNCCIQLVCTPINSASLRYKHLYNWKHKPMEVQQPLRYSKKKMLGT